MELPDHWNGQIGIKLLLTPCGTALSPGWMGKVPALAARHAARDGSLPVIELLQTLLRRIAFAY